MVFHDVQTFAIDGDRNFRLRMLHSEALYCKRTGGSALFDEEDRSRDDAACVVHVRQGSETVVA